MADDKPEDAGLAPESGRAKRTPPTIDLEATEVSTQPQEMAVEPEAQPEPEPAAHEQARVEGAEFGEIKSEAFKSEEIESEPQPERAEEQPAVVSAPISPWIIAPFSGAAAAAVVIGVGWILGWPAVQAPPATPQVTSTTVDALSGRVAAVEARASKPAVDPAMAARIDALEKSASSLRSDVANLRTQLDKTASTLNDAQSAPRAAAPDLATLSDRIAQLERAAKTERAELAQQGEKIADAKTMDDKPLRHVVAAALLDVAVRHGDAYQSQLAAARSMAAKPDMLKPLDTFAASGIPTPVALSRELLNIVPKLSPPVEAQTSGTGIVERLQAGASKLVRIERTDGVGNDRGAIVARVTAAALRNDFVEARRELKMLPEADRAPAQAWLDKADARDAALAASRKFADDAMADLVKPAQ
ncbi:COG4223 family protein [Bradyrhizobium symbiodeficiens]|uniref:COG4223 family protein n=1 Tax=Bradyrhizobium symbiodeficiens TaxID=1404367 RepID=UPI000BA1B9B0|nr:hypothetical protein [Bradyrhizobium symbiodeficiens]AWM10548.1 hypothetical protein CIT39_31625 [Bradyrhizobium symbiodeficiens]